VPAASKPHNATRSQASPEGDESRTRILHRATLGFFEDVSLEGVLQRIVSAAKELAEARYAALGIPDAEGELETFLTLGMSDEEKERIAHPPQGKGLLGEMIRQGKAIRIPNIRQHPKSVGFPAGHPEMRSFLGVPISAHGHPLGQLYLCDKMGAETFSDEDQRLIEILAAYAAAAIENARLYQRVYDGQAELTRRNEELELINYVATLVSAGPELEGVLDLLLGKVRSLWGARAGEIFLIEAGSNVYRLSMHQGDTDERFWNTDHFRLGEGVVGYAARRGEPLLMKDPQQEPQTVEAGSSQGGHGRLACIPMLVHNKVVGVLCLAFQEDRHISKREMDLLMAVGAGVGVTVENARLNRQARRLAILEERQRIGMDLHDGIIQSIYAVGLSLESVRMLLGEEAAEPLARLDQAIAMLNAIIRDIRTYILDLQPARMLEDDLGRALGRLATEFKANTGIDLQVAVEPDIPAHLERRVATEIYLIAQEALANVAKHAEAGGAWLTLSRTDHEILLQVVDNGKGFDMDKRSERLGHGLSNIAARASAIGGSSEVISKPGEGTTLRVRFSP
jgi:two-component system sensor histidine kinase DevS